LFATFFYKLKDVGIPVSPTSFLRLQKALSLGLIGSLEDFYTAARTILIKSERYFDLYDQVFAHYFKGAELPEGVAVELDEAAKLLLEEWLRDPEGVARALGAGRHGSAVDARVQPAACPGLRRGPVRGTPTPGLA